jgi:ABC-type phosphate transport system ATPase subunit
MKSPPNPIKSPPSNHHLPYFSTQQRPHTLKFLKANVATTSTSTSAESPKIRQVHQATWSFAALGDRQRLAALAIARAAALRPAVILHDLAMGISQLDGLFHGKS